jgi:hypothetical protein
MFQDFYAHSRLLIWPLIGLGIFLASFVGVLLYILIALRDRAKVERLSRLPLETEVTTTHAESEGRAS